MNNQGLIIRLLVEQEIPDYIPLMLGTMERALDRRGDWQVHEILTRALRGGILVWVAEENGKYLGHVTAKPRERDLLVITLGGERAKEWIPLVQEQLLLLCDKGDFDAVMTGARPGMAKWLRETGWKTIRHIMELKRG